MTMTQKRDKGIKSGKFIHGFKWGLNIVLSFFGSLLFA